MACSGNAHTQRLAASVAAAAGSTTTKPPRVLLGDWSAETLARRLADRIDPLDPSSRCA